MIRLNAPIIDRNEYQVIILCPYCSEYHRHGKTISVGESRHADCHKGEYILTEQIPPRIIQIALKKRDADCKRKRRTPPEGGFKRNRKPKEAPEPIVTGTLVADFKDNVNYII